MELNLTHFGHLWGPKTLGMSSRGSSSPAPSLTAIMPIPSQMCNWEAFLHHSEPCTGPRGCPRKPPDQARAMPLEILQDRPQNKEHKGTGCGSEATGLPQTIPRYVETVVWNEALELKGERAEPSAFGTVEPGRQEASCRKEKTRLDGSPYGWSVILLGSVVPDLSVPQLQVNMTDTVNSGCQGGLLPHMQAALVKICLHDAYCRLRQ